MTPYDRSKITEEPIQPHVRIYQKPRIAPVIHAEKSQADHIRIQNRIRDTIRVKDVSDLVIDGENRFSLRRMK